MSKELPKFFQRDRLLRDEKYRVLGRVMLRDESYELGKPIAVVLLQVPKQYMSDLRGKTFFIDGVKYRIPMDLPKQKFSGNSLLNFVNNFYLQPVE